MPEHGNGSVWSLARLVLAGRWRRVMWAVGLSVANGLFQGAVVVLVVPLLRVSGVSVGGTGPVAGIDRIVAEVFGRLGLIPSLPVVLVALVLLAWLQASVERMELIESARIEQDVELELRSSLYAAMLAARWSFFTRQRGSDLTHAITRDADRAGMGAAYLLRAAGQAVAAAVYLAFAVLISPWATLAALGGGGVLAFALRRTFRIAHATGEELSDASTELLALVTQHVEGIKLVKSFGAEHRTLDAFAVRADRSAQATVSATRAHAGAHVATAAGSATLLALVLLVALRWQGLPAADTLVLVFLFWRLLPRITDVQQSLRDAVHELPGYEAVQRVLVQCTAARETPTPTGSSVEQAPIIVRESVVVDSLSFAYSDATPVFTAAEARIAAGRMTAVTGPSGSGKTTLVDLLLGLLRPSAGRILVDGAPLRDDQLRAWRDAVAYVPQDALLFHDTVLANLLWACPEATQERVVRALRRSAADEFVDRLPDGLHTVVGDRGVRLSGGERQRLALARALLREPTLLVLDEPTSALDTESEARILEALRALRGAVTIFLVSHRPAPLRAADVVYVLDAGVIRDQVSGAL